MKITQKAKEIGRKYLAPAIIAAGLYFSNGNAYATDLPVETSIKAQMVRERETKLEEAVSKFNESIGNREFSVEEQKKVYSLLQQSGINMDMINPSDSVKELYSELRNNLECVDFGTPELELKLREQGVDIFVEPLFTNPEELLFGISGLGVSVAIIGLYYKWVRPRKMQED